MKSPRSPVGKPAGWRTNTYLVAYTIHIVNREQYKTPEGDPVKSLSMLLSKTWAAFA